MLEGLLMEDLKVLLKYLMNDLNNFVLSTNRSSPTTYQRADLTVRARNSSNSTLTNFNERVNFKV